MVTETSNANKEKRGREQAVELARSVKTIVVAKGKKVVRFELKKDAPDDETILAHLLGPTGNLRAPVIKKGNKLLVGFNADAYADELA